jgi:hypothetical protein
MRLHGSSVLAKESAPYELLANIPLVMQPAVVLGLAVIITLVCPVVTVEKINSVDTTGGVRGTIPSLVGGPGKISLAVLCPASLVRPFFMSICLPYRKRWFQICAHRGHIQYLS